MLSLLVQTTKRKSDDVVLADAEIGVDDDDNASAPVLALVTRPLLITDEDG